MEPNRTCEVCGKDFYKPPCRIKIGKGKYCSKACHNSVMVNRTECICRNCGKNYSVATSQKGKIFCGMDCVRQYNFEHRKYRDILNTNNTKQSREYRKRYWPERTCETCGKTFEADPEKVARGAGRFCGFGCYWESMRLHQTHEQKNEKMRKNLHKYRFGGNREKALERDGYRCTMCGIPNSLVVHHKDGKGYKSVGFKAMNNALDNLQTLCANCHTKLHNQARFGDVKI